MPHTHALNDLKVIEVAAYIPGPVCTQILADMGAAVIKIERPGGDPMRHMPPRPDHGGDNPIFTAINRGKHSITLDLKQPESVDAFRTLAQDADILVDGYRPGVLTRLGIDPAELRALNPRLIYCALSGYGANSPMRNVAGHDLTYLALSGFLALTHVEGTPAMPGTQIADMASGLMAATAILGALRERDQTGRGTFLDMALSDAALWLMTPWLAVQRGGLASGKEPEKLLSGMLACYNRYATADGRYLAVGALEPHFWANFCNALERPDLIAGQYDLTAQPALRDAVAALIVTQPLAHWQAVFANVDACVTPILTLEEAANLPLHHARELFTDDLGVRLPFGGTREE